VSQVHPVDTEGARTAPSVSMASHATHMCTPVHLSAHSESWLLRGSQPLHYEHSVHLAYICVAICDAKAAPHACGAAECVYCWVYLLRCSGALGTTMHQVVLPAAHSVHWRTVGPTCCCTACMGPASASHAHTRGMLLATQALRVHIRGAGPASSTYVQHWVLEDW